MSITELSIKRPRLVLVVFVVLTVLGLFSLSKLSYELIPKFTAPFVFITTTYPGASPAEVENSVTKVVEDAVSSMENIVSIRSTSFESMSLVFLELKDGADVNLAIADAQRKVSAAGGLLPATADPPALTKFAADEFPVLSIGATAKGASPTEFYDLVADRVKPALSSVEGVGEIRIIGGQEREIQVNVNRPALEQRGMSILQVVQAIRAANLDFPTGKIETEQEQVVVRLAGKFQTVEDLRSLVVHTNPATGAPVKLGEVAEVFDDKKDLASISRVDGRDAIGLQVIKTSDANSVAVSQGVLALLDTLEGQFTAQELKFDVANNQTDFTIEAVKAVTHDLGLSIVLVAVVMLFFLHSIRNAVIVMLAIPTSLVATLIMMYAAGFTLNLMTLLAMSLCIGILVDDSIVVLENIYRKLEHGMPKRRAAVEGRNEIAFTALAITLVDVVVFVPISLTSGIVGNIMRSFALVITFSTLMSLFVSFTLTPMLASRFSKLEKFNNRSLAGFFFNGFERTLTRINNWYARVIGRILNPYPVRLGRAKVNTYWLTILTFFGMLFLFVSSFSLVSNGYIGSAFIQQSDRGEFIMNLELPKDATLRQTNLAAQQAEEVLFKKEEVRGVFTTVGRSSGMMGALNTAYKAELTVKLVPAKERAGVPSALYAQRARNEMEMALPGVKVTSSEVSFFGGADEDPIYIFVSGSDKEAIMKYASEVLAEIRKIPGVLEPKLSVEEGNPEITVSVDRERMAQLGLTLDMVGGTMQTAFNGNDEVQFRSGDKEYDIHVKMDDFNRRSVSDIAGLSMMNERGQLVRLSQFADIRQSTGPNQLERKDRLPSVAVRGKVLGRAGGEVGEDIKRVFEVTHRPPPGVKFTYDGDIKQQAEGFGSLGLAMLASILFVYLIMVALYESWIYPLVVMFSIPLALIGALLAMALSMSVLDIFSILGLIMLIGLVAKNAILLVDFTNLAKRQGMKTREALAEAGRTRLRPILMTTIAMAVGMLPIALAKGAGSEWKNGLAWALVGGLLSSMVLTLVVVPVAYLFWDGVRSLFYRSVGVEADSQDEEEDGVSGNGVPEMAEPEKEGVF